MPRRPLVAAVAWAATLLAAFAAATLGGGWASGVASLTAVTGVASNLFSNVPAVLLLAPLVAEAAAGSTGFLTLAMASTLAGNLTVVGSVANLIVVEGARKAGVTVGFWAYLRVGLPITLITLVLGIAWLTRAAA
ncbi:MAG: hypothetical protein K0A98_08205 [Trueperaceae bacterium]|nr:hypothetical protein [Trueperaceae bacterium]